MRVSEGELTTGYSEGQSLIYSVPSTAVSQSRKQSQAQCRWRSSWCYALVQVQRAGAGADEWVPDVFELSVFETRVS